MNFLETLAKDADSKFSQMLAGETKSPIETIEVASSSKFATKNKAFHQRLQTEATELEESLATIKRNKQRRLKNEELKKQQQQEAEEERLKKQKQEAERARREAERLQAEKVAKKKKMIKLIIALSIVAVIVISIIIGVAVSNKKKQEAAKLEELNYGCSHISMTVDSKTNGEQSYGYYITNFKITIINGCQRDITYLKCNMLINAVDSDVQLWKGDVSLTGDVSSNGGKSTWNLELKSTSNELWNYPLVGLKIQCQWTRATFDEPDANYNTTKTYTDSYKVVYSGNANYKSDMYQQAKSYYNQGKYQEAYDIFVQLGTYSDSATWAEKCDEKITEQNRLQGLNQFKEYLSFIGNNIPVPSKVEYWGTPGTGTTYYEGSDRNCVYGSGYIYNVANGLNFVSNYKDELIAAGYTEVTGGSHYNDCDYYYKKDNIVIGFNDPIDSYYEYYIYMVVLKVNEM